jgi:hypothetical protein
LGNRKGKYLGQSCDWLFLCLAGVCGCACACEELVRQVNEGFWQVSSGNRQVGVEIRQVEEGEWQVRGFEEYIMCGFK